MRTRLGFVFLLAATTAACASSGATASSATAAAPGRRDPELITKDELSDPTFRSLNLYDVIKTLRPRFFNTRGTQSMAVQGADPESGQVHASIDGNGLITLEDLKRLPVGGVQEVRYLSPAAAMQKFGAPSKQGAVILVRTM